MKWDAMFMRGIYLKYMDKIVILKSFNHQTEIIKLPWERHNFKFVY